MFLLPAHSLFWSYVIYCIFLWMSSPRLGLGVTENRVKLYRRFGKSVHAIVFPGGEFGAFSLVFPLCATAPRLKSKLLRASQEGHTTQPPLPGLSLPPLSSVMEEEAEWRHLSAPVETHVSLASCRGCSFKAGITTPST